MRILSTTAAFAIMASLLAGCGGQDTGQSMAQGENQQASQQSASDIYMPAETAMNERMAAAEGASAADTWMLKMIEHHRGAVAMANIAVTSAGNEMVIAMARQTIEKQTREIAELQRLLPS